MYGTHGAINMDEDNYFVSSATVATMSERLKALFEGLPTQEARNMLEEFFDDYADSVYGSTVLNEMRKLRLVSKGQCVTTQVLGKGRAILVSSYGFKVVSESQCKCGKMHLVLDELNEQDKNQERSGRL